ncbi:MAG: site-2 protease family protein [Evtepia gabavorous]
MGPALVSFQRGETQYSLRAFPIGGYCAMEGEDEENDNPRSFSNKSPWRKLIILAAGSVMNFIAGFVLVAILFGTAGSYVVPVVRDFMERLLLRRGGGTPGGGPDCLGERPPDFCLLRPVHPAQHRHRGDHGPGGGAERGEGGPG